MAERLSWDPNTERKIGEGASAQVYAATAPDGRRLAIKRFKPEWLAQVDSLSRAHHEFAATHRLNHPNIVGVLEARLDPASSEPKSGDSPLLIMELVEGASLAEFQPQLPYVLPELAALVVLEIARALEYAHAQGVIHRDLKPGNVLVSREGQVRVTDFGMAKLGDRSMGTATGALLGSPAYMSPEQARGDVVSEASDVFSAGSILYFLVTGTHAFDRGAPLPTLAAVADAAPEPAQARNPKLSRGLAAIIARAMAKRAQDRYASARELRTALGTYLGELGVMAPGSEGGAATLLAEFVRQGSGSAPLIRRTLERVAERLLRRAQDSLNAGNGEQALAAIEHLGLVAPASQHLEGLMDQLAALAQHRPASAPERRRRGILVWLPLAAGALGLVVVGGRALVGSRGGAPATTSLPAAKTSLPSATTPVAPASIEAQATPVAIPTPASPRAAASPPQSTSTPARAQPMRAKRGSVAATARAASPSPPTLPVAARVSPASNPEPAREEIRFAVAPGIKVFWNGRRIDPTKPHRAPVGFHQLTLILPGQAPLTQRIEVKRGEPTDIRVGMRDN